MNYHCPKKIKQYSEQFLRECFVHNAELGELSWKQRPEHHFENSVDHRRWNNRYAGHKAGSINAHGYCRVSINSCFVLVSHICWFFGTGQIPEYPLDHINGCRSDNRLSNLREAPGPLNQRNSRLSLSNKTGLVGINPRTYRGKYTYFVATVRVGAGEKQCTRTFKTLEQAVAWRQNMVTEIGDYHPNHGRL